MEKQDPNSEEIRKRRLRSVKSFKMMLDREEERENYRLEMLERRLDALKAEIERFQEDLYYKIDGIGVNHFFDHDVIKTIILGVENQRKFVKDSRQVLEDSFNDLDNLHFHPDQEIAALIKMRLLEFVEELRERLAYRKRDLRGVFIEISSRFLSALQRAHQEEDFNTLVAEKERMKTMLESERYCFYLQEETANRIKTRIMCMK